MVKKSKLFVLVCIAFSLFAISKMYGSYYLEQRIRMYSAYSNNKIYGNSFGKKKQDTISKSFVHAWLPSGTSNAIQMSEDQIRGIKRTISAYGNVLVWGLGNDSPFWHNSTKGKVIFIEDNSHSRKAGIQWYDKIMQKYPYLKSYRVKYKTKNIQSFPIYINNSERWHELDLSNQLPESVTQTHWHVIIVDAPLGCCRTGPGRYQSIYTSWKLAKEGAHIFVDDFERKVEHEFSTKMFGKPEEIIKRERTKFSRANEQAHFILKANYSFKQIYGTRKTNITESGIMHFPETEKDNYFSHNWSLLVNVNDGYFDIFMNWRLHFIKLNMSLPIYVITEDDIVHNKLVKLNGNGIYITRSEIISINESAFYNSISYRKIVSARPSYILSLLKEGINTIYCDIDTVWLKDPRPYLTGNFDMWSQMDVEERGIFCSCFLALRSNNKTINLMKRWQEALNVSLTRNQPIFNKLMQLTSLKTKALNSTFFPSGKQYFDLFTNEERSKAVVVHNNWIKGHDRKINRFKKRKLWLNGTIH